MQKEWCDTIFYKQVQNIVQRFATLQLCLPITPTPQPSFTLGQCVATFCKLIVITSTGNLPLLYVPKHHVTLATFFSEMIILGILWVRAKSSKHLTWENDTLRNHRSHIITHCLNGWLFRTGMNEWYFCENNAYGNDAEISLYFILTKISEKQEWQALKHSTVPFLQNRILN
jgi:hypothetical protein